MSESKENTTVPRLSYEEVARFNDKKVKKNFIIFYF